MIALTLETTLQTFALAFVTACAVTAVSAAVSAFRYRRKTDKAVHDLTRWAHKVGRELSEPFPPNGDDERRGNG